MFYVLENFHHNFANLVAPPTDRSAKCLMRCKVHLVLWRKQRPNRCIIGDAILPQTDKKLTKNAVLNLALCCGAIWCRRQKPQYRCTTTDTHVHNSVKDIWENLLPVWLLVHTNLFVSNHFWTTCTKFDTWCQRYYSDMQNCFYIVHIYVLLRKLLRWDFQKNLSAIYTKWCEQTLSPIFGVFEIFDRNFGKIVAPPGAEMGTMHWIWNSDPLWK